MLQVPIRSSVWRRLRVAAAARDLAGVGPLVDEILDGHLPPLPAGYVADEEPEEHPKKRKAS